MHRIEDEAGETWDVVLGRESWGAFFALFIPRKGDVDRARKSLLEARDQGEALRALIAMDRDELLELLRNSVAKEK